MAQQGSGRWRGWIGGIAALAIVIFLVFYLRSEFRGTVDVRVAPVEYQNISTVVSTNGKVEPIVDFQAHAPGPGVIAKVFVTLGQKVSQGQELVRMDDSDARNRLASAQAALVASEASLKNMQGGGTQDELLGEKADLAAAQTQQTQAASALASLQALQAKGAASANEVAAAAQKLQAAQARLGDLNARRTGRYGTTDFSAQQAQVAQARQAVETAEAALAGVDIRSPLSGTVYFIPVSHYDFVEGGEALLNVADLTRLHVRAYFDEPEIGKLKVGQPVKIVWDARPNQEWHGHIQQAPTTIISYGTRNVGECVITVDDAKGDLLPNTNVTVTVTTLEHLHVLSIPREALYVEGQGQSDFVYKIVDGHLRKTQVQVGPAINLTRAEIVSGLSEGDKVATGANSEDQLTDGLQIKAQP